MSASVDGEGADGEANPDESSGLLEDPPSWVELRDHVERQLKKFSIQSVADSVMDDLWEDRPAPDQLKALPWLALLIAKWSLQLGSTIRVGRKLPKDLLLLLKRALWDGNDRAFVERTARHEAEFGLDRPQPLSIMMRIALATQMQFQRQEIWGLYRTAGLIRPLDANHRSKRIFREQIGLEVEEFIDGCIFLYTLANRDGARELNAVDVEHFKPMRDGMIRKVLALMSRSLPDLRLELLQEAPMKGSRSRELYVFPVFKRFPLLRTRQGRYWCWHRSVLDRYMDEAVHLELSKAGQKYADSFSMVFEKYVVDQSQRLGFPLTTAQQYLDAYGRGEKIKNVEAVVTHGNRRLLIESKMGLFPDDVLFQETELGNRGKLKRVLEAVEQGQTVSHKLATSHPEDQEHYLIVVTSRDLVIGTGLFLEDMCGPGSLAAPVGTEGNLLPLNHMFVLSIDEFERLVEFVASGRLSLFDQVASAAKSSRNLAGCAFNFSSFYPKELAGIGQRIRMPAFIAAEHRAAMDRLSLALEAHQTVHRPQPPGSADT
ncbi:hypothetical protein [Paucibacter sp. M5-1]|uniref:hypothetical protein n=1 Tax=Paucibacter sp. M5-1 TaxID=3015998 RepID=UPI0022B860C8|nr:hypothetical protein [Paucibacter sp. M5-1]MCZ7881553.1 hypothetical protein [Paucibacter sp. M5-1]